MKKKSIIILCAIALVALIVVVAGKDMWFGGFHFGPPEVGPLPSEASWIKVDATINEDSYSPGEDIVIELTFQNNSTDMFLIEPFPPKIMVMPSLKYGLAIREFPEGEEAKSLEPGEMVSYTLTWDQRDKNGQQVPAGDYKLALGNIDAWNQRFMLTLDKPAEITITSPGEKTSETSDIIETIRIFKVQTPDNPPPPGGWTFQTTGPRPDEIQEVFVQGDKLSLGMVISEQLKDDISFSGYAFFNRETGIEEAVTVSPDDLGPFEPDGEYYLGYKIPWEIPDENGEYELRVYLDTEVVASALFNIGVWPASWGPEMEYFPAPIHEVKVIIEEPHPPPDPWVFVYIKGGLPDSCTTRAGINCQYIGNIINIEVTTKRPKEAMCAQVYGYFEETIPIGGDRYISGETYTVNVNDYTATFVMP